MSPLTFITLVFFVLSHLIDAWGVENSGVALRQLPRSNSPRLSAVTVRSNLQRREDALKPKHHCEHSYADHTSIFDGGRTRVAKTAMEYKLPALILEDIETSLEDIQCFDSTISVRFAEAQVFNAAKDLWDISEFLIISSHPGCNQDGERSPHLVSGVVYKQETLTTVFSTSKIQWKGSYTSMTVKFGMSHELGLPRIHEGLRRRQAASSSVSGADAPTATPGTNSSISADIGFQVPDDAQEIFSLSNTVGLVTDSATVNCKNCSVSGTIDLVEGEIIVSNSTTAAGKAVDFINTGYFKIVANNLSAHVELDTILSLSTTQSFNKTLTTIGLPGFEIPGIVTIGPFFKPVITGSLALQGAIDFTYGFNLRVPDNSTILLNVGALNESYSQGFNNAQISVIPLSASSPSISLTLGIGLRAEIDLGIDILSGDGSMDAGAFIDLPSMKVTIANLAGVNKQCDPITNITSVEELLSYAFPNLTHIVPEIGIDVGLQVEAGLSIPEANFHTSIGSQAVLAGTSYTMPTACLSFDAANKAFVTPTVTSTTINTVVTGAAATGSGAPKPGAGGEKAKSSGSRTRENPLAGEIANWWAGCMLLSVFLVALSL